MKLKEKLSGGGDNIKYERGPIPTKRSQLLAKFASLKILKFIIFEVAQGGGMGQGLKQSLGAIASYAASLTGVNCSFSKYQVVLKEKLQ